MRLCEGEIQSLLFKVMKGILTRIGNDTRNNLSLYSMILLKILNNMDRDLNNKELITDRKNF